MEGSATSELVARARHGEETAREELFGRHAGKLRLYLRARLGTALARAVEAEDLVQETYLRAVRDLDAFTPAGPSAFERWLLAIGRHVLADAARAARAKKRSGGRRLERSDWSRTASSALPPDSGPGPITRLLRSEEQARLERALLALPAHYRRMIVLRQLEQRSALETAARIGSTEAAVHAMFRRALLAWHAELGRL